jgi:hypothetical protein
VSIALLGGQSREGRISAKEEVSTASGIEKNELAADQQLRDGREARLKTESRLLWFISHSCKGCIGAR